MCIFIFKGEALEEVIFELNEHCVVPTFTTYLLFIKVKELDDDFI